MKLKITLTLVGMALIFALSACATTPASTSSASPTVVANPPGATAATGSTGLSITDAWARTVNMGAMAESTPGAMASTPSAMDSTPAAMEGTPKATDMGSGDVMAQQMGAVYMNIANAGAADKLIKAQTNVAKTVELHTVLQEGGVMQMRPVPAIDVPANGSVQLKPGGFHVMLIGVNQELKAGDIISVTLTFENAGEREIQAQVRSQ